MPADQSSTRIYATNEIARRSWPITGHRQHIHTDIAHDFILSRHNLSCSSSNPTMKASTQIAAALSLFSALAAALPPAPQARTNAPPTPSRPPATGITITSLATTSAGTISGAKSPPSTAAVLPVLSFLSQPPPPFSPDPLIAGPHHDHAHALPIPPPSAPAVLELRSAPTGTTTTGGTNTGPITITAAEAVLTTTTHAFPEKWYQTTFWSCVTEAVQTHCGWHEPVLPGGDNSLGGAAEGLAGGAPMVLVWGIVVVVVAGVRGWGG